MKRFFNGLGILVLLLLAFACYRVMTMPPIQPRLIDLSPAEQKRRRADAQQLVKQTENVARSVKRHENGPWTLTATGEQLNTLLQDRLRIQGLPIQNLGIVVKSGQLALTGSTNYKGFNVPIALAGTIETPDGKLNFLVQSLTLGGFPINGGWRDKAQTAITKGLTQALGKSNARFDSVTLETDKLTVSGHTGA